MRQDYTQFTARNAEIIAIGPDGPNAFKRYWQENNLPFIGCPDLRSRVASQYDQEFNLLKMGRMPALFVIDLEGKIRFQHYGDSMKDIPTNASVLAILDKLQAG
ncbi:peroxiredoxin [Anaerolinea thermolimosa]|nr:peroxiredoxin [Anaerolinea thermolimosa]